MDLAALLELLYSATQYNSHLPHRSLNLKPPIRPHASSRVPCPRSPGIERRDRLGSLIHEYSLAHEPDFAHPTRDEKLRPRRMRFGSSNS